MLKWPQSLVQQETDISRLLASVPTANTIPKGWLAQWEDVWCPLAAHIATLVSPKLSSASHAPIIGIHGGQGSGKSTLSLALKEIYQKAYGWNVVVVSIDDLYLTHAERQTLGQNVHPLLITRGVPGTHNTKLGISLFTQLRALSEGESCKIPAFDKASDDRLPESQWHNIHGPVDLILFEGWCVGCQPVDIDALVTPVNDLEANEDTNAQWRTWVNDQLATTYTDWFATMDYLIMLKVPDMAAVQRWRSEQEKGNRSNTQGSTDRSLDDAGIARFIQHYERLTKQALTTLPEIANLILEINPAHRVSAIRPGKAK